MVARLRLLTICLFLASCGGKEKDPQPADPIVGTWRVREFYIGGPSFNPSRPLHYTFKADQTYLVRDTAAGQLTTGIWRRTDNAIAFKREGAADFGEPTVVVDETPVLRWSSYVPSINQTAFTRLTRVK